ncbi:MAG: hypothetical protein EOP09_08265 [Proteobacteria bacterium]|nr:MAG: hypothetical protein EOP09_08265 [Pseudomonadota bacterium]
MKKYLVVATALVCAWILWSAVSGSSAGGKVDKLSKAFGAVAPSATPAIAHSAPTEIAHSEPTEIAHSERTERAHRGRAGVAADTPAVPPSAGNVRLQKLKDVVVAPIVAGPHAADPHSADHGRLRYQRSLRITALEELDQLGFAGENIEPALLEILSQQQDPAILFLVKISLMGVQQKRPGKLSRFIDATFAQVP